MYSPAEPDDRRDLEMSAFQQIIADFSAMNLTYLAEWLQSLPDGVLMRLLPPDHYMFEGWGAVRELPHDEFEGNLENLLDQAFNDEFPNGHNTKWWVYEPHHMEEGYVRDILGVN